MYRVKVKINSDLFSFYSFQIVEHGATFFYAGLNAVVSRATKFYKKSRSKKLFFSDKLCCKAKAFLSKDNWFIFGGILKIKVNKRTKVFFDNSSASRVAYSCNIKGNTNLKCVLPSLTESHCCSAKSLAC